MTRIISVLLFLSILGNLTGQTWLKKIHPPAGSGKYSVTLEAGRFVYQTKSFRIVTFKKHDHTLMTDFTKCLESVQLALRNIPVPLYAPSRKQKGQLLILEHDADYLAAGGPKNTAGYYDGAKNRTLINWTHFRNNTTQTRLLQEPAFDLIIHELTHLSMHNLMWKCQPWLSEGIAEYMASSHVGRGNFDFSRMDLAIRKRIEKHTKPGSISSGVLGIRHLLSLSSKAWLERTAKIDAWEALKAYNCALLLSHYCLHGGAGRLKATREHFEALHTIQTTIQEKPRLILKNDAKKIEVSIAEYWKKRGLRVRFHD
jgi:hypothetical protein